MDVIAFIPVIMLSSNNNPLYFAENPREQKSRTQLTNAIIKSALQLRKYSGAQLD